MLSSIDKNQAIPSRPGSCLKREYKRHVQWHQKNSRTCPKRNGTSQVIKWRSTFREEPTDENMDGTLCRLCKTQFITATALDIMSLIQNQQQKTWPQEDPSVPGITVQEFRTATPTLLLERKKRATAH